MTESTFLYILFFCNCLPTFIFFLFEYSSVEKMKIQKIHIWKKLRI